MSGSAWLPLLGRKPDARLLILHADDVGMCEASLSAFRDLTDVGTVSSGSVMAPCPWFPAVADYCSTNANVDLGVHLTLTSEWQSYRWGPVSSPDPSSGLTDAAGYFHRDRTRLNLGASAHVAGVEMRAQIQRALGAGIHLTHLDAHMFACLAPAYLAGYVGLAREFGLPALVWPSAWEEVQFPHAGTNGPGMLDDLRTSGFLFIDDVVMIDSSRTAERADDLRAAVSRLRPGVTHLLVHPSADTPELRSITPAGWRNRVADYNALRDPGFVSFIRESGVELIGYRELRDALHAR